MRLQASEIPTIGIKENKEGKPSENDRVGRNNVELQPSGDSQI